MQQLVNIILASASPRRRDLMQQLGLKFSVEVFPVDEKNFEPDPIDKVNSIVEQKMNEAVKQLPKHSLEKSCVVCADTIVVINDTVLGKANNKDEAKEMLKKLSGQKHTVMTAFSLYNLNREMYSEVVVTQVEFMTMTDSIIDQYLCYDEYKDKAGAYAIQGLAGSYVKEVQGSYSNVIGLPQVQVLMALEKLKVIEL
ncbi:MAG TPA: Maf family protein [Oligoflexia bacterium]|nr:Maf family protein [Oligoflexia bacterium]HMR23743.1 Maf family protein [Oligoflexia bacterium]